jgi:hypothetical protein
MTIQVTWDDIRQGSRTNSQSCAVALAVRRVTGYSALVLPHEVLVGNVPHQLPSTVRNFITRFDMLPHVWPFVRPFAFDLQMHA